MDILATNYFESFTEFWHVNNNINNRYVNILCCNIVRSVNSNLDKLTLFLENNSNSDKTDVIILTESRHNPLNQNVFAIEDINKIILLYYKKEPK